MFSKDRPLPTLTGNAIDSFQNFIDCYCTRIYSAAARLSGLSGKPALEALTIRILADLWGNRMLLPEKERPEAFVYKVLIRQVFAWLAEHGDEDRIQLLKTRLLINPFNYTPVPQTEKKIVKITLLRKMRRIWKTS